MQASKSGGRPKNRRTLTRLTTLGVGALAAAAVAAPAANSTIGPGGVAPGHNITVFHNIDFVATFGNPGNLTVDVIRGGVTVGRAAGPSVDAGEGPALEVNHGPEAAAQPGDCFIGHVPDVQPGDLIRVTNNDVVPPADAVDEVIVDDIGFLPPPVEDTVITDPITGAVTGTGNVLVHGWARRANGDAIPTAFLDSAEFRAAVDPQLRGAPDEVIANAANGVGGFTMVYDDPWTPDRNRNGLNAAQIKAALLGDGHATGFGHVDPLPLESMLVDGLEVTPGPAPGCEGEVKNSIIDADDNAVNTTSDTLVLNGGRLDPAGIPQITVSDTDPTTPNIGPFAATTAGGAWDVTVPRADLESLANGELTVTAAGFSGAADGNAADETLRIQKATVGPPGAIANPPEGSYVGAQSVSLTGQSVKYSTDGGPADLPYSGPIALDIGTTTINTSTTDSAGNVTERSFTYVITAPVAATPVAQAVQAIAPALAPKAPRVSLTVARSSYRFAGSTPLRSARRNGVRVFYTPLAGAERMRFAVYRSAGTSARRALVKRTVRVRPGLRSVALKWRGMRAGRYVLEVRALKGARSGRPSKRNFRITR